MVQKENIILVNKERGLPKDYVPDDLVVPDILFDFEGNLEKRYLRKEAAKALENMFQEAKRQGICLCAISGYRSYKRQAEIYENNIKIKGAIHTEQYSAKPGHSEHQTGLAMDVSCASCQFELEEEFASTPEGLWLSFNAPYYGFILRYPYNKTAITGYAYEPWHIRYVGYPLSIYISKNNLTLEEFYMDYAKQYFCG